MQSNLLPRLSLTLLTYLTCGSLGCTGTLDEGDLSTEADTGVRGSEPSENGAAETGPSKNDAEGDASIEAAPPAAGPLAGLPSSPGAHIEKLMALGDDEWLRLGAPDPDPKYGRALGRSWGGRALVGAPELRAAFYFGEGPHAMVKSDGYGMDDLWAYDIMKNRWIAVHPGTEIATFNQRVKDKDLHIDESGMLVDKTAQPIPVHTLIHAWDFLTYDTDRRAFAFLAGDGLGRYYMPGEPAISEGLTLLEEQRKGKVIGGRSPWFYDTMTGRFARTAVTVGQPDVGGYPYFQYLASRKQYFLGGSGGVALYDPKTPGWTTVKDEGPRPKGYDHGGCYDDKRERLYMGPGSGDESGNLYVFDLKTSTWTTPAVKGTGPRSFSTNNASIIYDKKNDVVVVLHYLDRAIYTYAPSTETWSKLKMPDAFRDSVGYPSFNAFYDEVLNVYFAYAAADGGDNGIMWAYRLKK